MSDNVYTIKSLSLATGLSQVYIRRAIHQRKLETSLEPIAEDSNVKHHVITQEQFEAWRGSVSSRSRREDGRNKFNLYATPEEYEALVQMLEKEGFEVIVVRANVAKSTAAIKIKDSAKS